MAHKKNRWSGSQSREKSDGFPKSFDALCNNRVGVSHVVWKMFDDLQSTRVKMSVDFLTFANDFIFRVCL